MHTGLTRRRTFSHRSLSVLGKSTLAGLVGVAVFSLLMWLTIKDLPFFLLLAAIMAVCAAFLLTGVRWMPFLSSAICACFLYFLLIPSPFAFNHLAHPKDTDASLWISFGVFVIILSFVWCLITAIWTGISTGVQNYQHPERQAPPRWFSAAMTGMFGLLLGSLLIAAIGQPGSAAATIDTSGNGVVHMGVANFEQPTMTISKGKKLELVNDASSSHILSTGYWTKGHQVVRHQANEPVINNVEISGTGKSVEIGPFNMAGTYYVLCTVHPGMTLTIIVR